MKNKIKRVFLSFFLFFLFSKASAQNNPEIGPLNPAFLNYLNLKQTGMIYHQTETGKTLGKTPSTIPVIFSTKTFTTFKQTQSAPPASYDLRNFNKITPVKNQGACGDCWAYAAMASLESYFMPNESLDLSEEHLNVYNGFDFGSCNGGNDQMSAAYFTRWSGPVTETSSDVIKHVQNIIFLPPRNSPTDNTNIKNAIMSYGAVGASFHYSNGYYNSLTSSYYAPVSTDTYSSNHEVAIIGWDDNYAKSNFSTSPSGQPPDNGAFICKNSWGTDWGSNGYFYVSYYDGVFARDYYVTAYTGEGIKNYSKIYDESPLGWVVDLGYNDTTAWYSTIFTATDNHLIQAVGFYTNDYSANYDIYVYKDVIGNQPTNGVLAYSANGSFDLPGFHTISIGNIFVEKEKKFSVVIKAQNTTNKYPIPAEAKWSGYSGSASASGNSYTSPDGISWTALGSGSGIIPTDTTIKVYTANKPPSGIVKMTDNLIRPIKNPAIKTKISLTTFISGKVKITIYDINGKMIKTLCDTNQNAGTTDYFWDGKNDSGNFVASGVYLIKVNGPYTDITEKVVVIK